MEDAALIDEVLRRTSLLGLVALSTDLRRFRGGWRGHCAGHRDDDENLHVLPASGHGLFHCFSCGARGDAVQWLMNERQLDRAAAVAVLAAAAGLPRPSASDE